MKLINRFSILILTFALLVMPCADALAAEIIGEDDTVYYIPEDSDIIDTDVVPDVQTGTGDEEADDPENETDDTVDGWDSDTVDKNDLKENNGFTDEELYLAAQLIYAEGNAQSKASFEAMASVVYHRIKSKKWPNTVEEVTFQKGQFSVTHNREKFLAKIPSQAAKDAVYKVFVLKKPTLPSNIMFFRAAKLGKKWSKARTFYKCIGGNNYYS